MNKFLDTYTFQRLNNKEPENVKRPVMSNMIESIIREFSIKAKHRNRLSLW
jgi:hypothetical protein